MRMENETPIQERFTYKTSNSSMKTKISRKNFKFLKQVIIYSFWSGLDDISQASRNSNKCSLPGRVPSVLSKFRTRSCSFSYWTWLKKLQKMPFAAKLSMWLKLHIHCKQQFPIWENLAITWQRPVKLLQVCLEFRKLMPSH